MLTGAEGADPLPPTLAELCATMGMAATLELVRWRGGRRVYVPTAVTDDHPLAEVIGMEAARALAARFPGARLEVPRAVRLVRAQRDREIRAAAAHTSQAELARQYGLTQRQIRTILAAPHSDPAAENDRRQPCLL